MHQFCKINFKEYVKKILLKLSQDVAIYALLKNNQAQFILEQKTDCDARGMKPQSRYLLFEREPRIEATTNKCHGPSNKLPSTEFVLAINRSQKSPSSMLDSICDMGLTGVGCGSVLGRTGKNPRKF
ncbi:hypothetical protein SDJN02_12502, partial [Cucurbita argyrosperma subsp. argyrosperma]